MFSKVLAQRKLGEYPKGLSNQAIERVSDYSEKHFGCSLPESYAKFLKEANGFSYDGHSIYCCYNDDIREFFPMYMVLDFVTINTDFYENTDISDYLMLGQSSLDYVCYEKASGKYLILTNGTMKTVAESEDFNSLLELFYGI